MATVSQKLGDCGDCGASAQAHGQRGRRRHGRISAVARELVRAVDLDPSSTQTVGMPLLRLITPAISASIST
ncbi:hypothetical protein OsJ_01676 [Oryza sativa Japonica Group]|uniref:Uncharacterized protein n=1 Tax=Oryza sativa subsp. japonica TaxID=39947 RepID=A2ZSV5_ORYSJ|nr:hypothetical protein OsJ_01676 [Oryza sativa Japonica Group]